MVPMQPPFPFVPGEYRVRLAEAAWERAQCAALRRAVFCDEQRVFVGSDRDALDEAALPIAAIACTAGMPDQVVGTVRIHETAAGEWFGSRLAVHRDFRGVAWIGTELIRHAVGTARARGCTRFLAHVQSQNARLFHRLAWQTLREVDLHGRPHHLMVADLSAYPHRSRTDVAVFPVARCAA
jgi:putative N-acetyltransferase (TIGR04045 family)